ncbi:MAG: hypothetical protein F9K24_22110 [Leptonema illini]|uniref:Uncharacterized protein n=1 Tax=Leptonema illini TaxID=183 RepID=A0A833LWN5_9LEPT|nr:MAG: hypothetical protein F9K24_22110 [Leptonema illini]
MNGPGFGELGDGGNRPSGIYLGFYNKLDLVNRYIDGKDSDRMERMAGSIDPLTATVNQFNPVSMIATAMQNVRVASEVYGTGEGYMWEAQALGAVKGALPAIGAAIGSIAGPAGTAIGSAIGSALASTIHVDAKTGKRDYQTTDQTGISLAIAAATWSASSYAQSAMTAAQQSAEAIRMTQEAIAITSAAVSGGMKYDENGRLQGGFDVTGASISAVSSYAGENWGGAFGGGKVGSFLASDITSTILNTGVQYYNYSHGYQNNYAALANPDLTRLGSLAGGLGVAAYNDNKAREFIGWARDAGHSEEAIINGLNTLGYSEFAEQLQNELANQTDQAYRVGMSAAGLMRRKEEEAGWVDEYGGVSDFDDLYGLPEGYRLVNGASPPTVGYGAINPVASAAIGLQAQSGSTGLDYGAALLHRLGSVVKGVVNFYEGAKNFVLLGQFGSDDDIVAAAGREGGYRAMVAMKQRLGMPLDDSEAILMSMEKRLSFLEAKQRSISGRGDYSSSGGLNDFETEELSVLRLSYQQALGQFETLYQAEIASVNQKPSGDVAGGIVSSPLAKFFFGTKGSDGFLEDAAEFLGHVTWGLHGTLWGASFALLNVTLGNAFVAGVRFRNWYNKSTGPVPDWASVSIGGPNGEDDIIGLYGGFLNWAPNGSAMTLGSFVFFNGMGAKNALTSGKVSKHYDSNTLFSLASHEEGHEDQNLVYGPLQPIFGFLFSLLPNWLDSGLRSSQVKQKWRNSNWYWLDRQANQWHGDYSPNHPDSAQEDALK